MKARRLGMDPATFSDGDTAVVVYDQQTKLQDIASIEELLHSPSITLTVGLDQSQTTVQSTLFRGMSKPLHELLNSEKTLNGDMTEVNASLRYDDKVAFMQLLKAAYATIVKGKPSPTITTPQENITQILAPPASITAVTKAKCPECKKRSVQLFYACLSCNSSLSENDDDLLGLDTFFLVQFHQSIEAACKKVAAQSSAAGLTPVSIDLQDPVSSMPYNLLHFARVHALANKYEMQAVKVAAMKSFYRRLRKVHIIFEQSEVDSVMEIVDVLRYLANGYGPPAYICKMTETSDLLNCLMRYIVVRIDIMLADEEFRLVMADNGGLGLLVMEILRQSTDVID